MNKLCVTCLSYDRRLFLIDMTKTAWIGFRFKEDARICWECKATLFRMHMFREQVKIVQRWLINKKDTSAWRCVSRLRVHRKDTYDKVYLYQDSNDNNSDEIKVELFDPDESKDNYVLNEVYDTKINVTKEEPDDLMPDDPLNPDDSRSLESDIPVNIIRPTNHLVVSVRSGDDNLQNDKYPSLLQQLKLSSIEGKAKKEHGTKKLEDGVASSSRTVESRYVSSSSEGSADDCSVGNQRNKPKSEKYLVRNLTEEEMQQARQQQRTRCVFLNAQYKCETCIILFKTEKMYQNHMDNKHSEAAGLLQCRICSQRFRKEGEARVHFYDHYRVYQCCRCDFTRPCLSRVIKHYSKTHRTGGSFGCRRCGENFPTNGELRAHTTEQHARYPKTECQFCHKSVTTINLTFHQKRCTDQTAVRCPVCGKHCKGNLNLRWHMNIKHWYECDDCGFKTKEKQKLLHHIEREHLKVPRYQCDHCEEKFTSGDQKHKHLRMKHKNKILKSHMKVPCPICKKEFSTPSTMRLHLRVHTGDRPFLCHYCPMTFAQSSTLRTHVKGKHKEQLQLERTDKDNKQGWTDCFECDDCGRKCKTKQEVLFHIERQHLKILRYQCQHCGQKFMSGNQKYRHVRLKHKIPKPANKSTCTICRKEFTCSKALKVHHKVHDIAP